MTHFLSSSTNNNVALYETISTSSPSEYAELNTEIQIIDTFVGFTCGLHKISSSFGERYADIENVFPLPDTKPFPDHVCLNQTRDNVWVPPEWQRLSDYEPFYDYQNLEYCIVVTTKQFNFSSNTMNQESLLEGVEKLLTYYNRRLFDDFDTPISFSDSAKDLVNNYFNFAYIKDNYVPYRLNSRIKTLVAIPAKYFEAVPEDITATTVSTSSETSIDISKANFILKIDLSELEEKFEILQNILERYNDDIYLSNSRLGYTLNFSLDSGFAGSGFRNTGSPLLIGLNLNKKANNIKLFYNELIKFLSRNGLPTSQSDDVSKKSHLEFVINDDCNVLYAIAVNVEGTCKIPRIGFDAFLNNTYVNDETTIAFVKNINAISKISKCDVSWAEFVQTYVYPKVILNNLGYNDVVAGSELDLEKMAKQLIQDVRQVYDSIVQQGKFTPLKPHDEKLDFNNKLRNDEYSKSFTNQVKNEGQQFIFKTKEIFEASRLGAMFRFLNQAGNFFDPIQMEKFFEEINAYLFTGALSKKKRYAALDEANVWRVVVYNQAGGYYRFPSVDDTAFTIAELESLGSTSAPGKPSEGTTDSLRPVMFKSVEKQGFDKTNRKVKDPATGKQVPVGEQGRKDVLNSLPKVEIRIEKQSQFEKFKDNLKNKDIKLHRKIYNALEKIGICVLVEKVIKCILAILNSFIDATFTDVPLFSFFKGALASKTSQEILEEVIPYLGEQDQKEVYFGLLSKLSKDNREKALIILKNTLPQEEYDSLGFSDSTSIENIYSVLADKMSVSV